MMGRHTISASAAWPYNAPQNLDHRISYAGEGRKEAVHLTMPRRQHSGEFKARAALETIRGERTRQDLAAAYGVHPVQIAQWKNMALEELPTRFSSRRRTKQKAEDALKAAWYQQIGQLNVELDWLKKKLALPVEATRALLEPAHPQRSLRRPCALLGVARSATVRRTYS